MNHALGNPLLVGRLLDNIRRFDLQQRRVGFAFDSDPVPTRRDDNMKRAGDRDVVEPSPVGNAEEVGQVFSLRSQQGANRAAAGKR
ncbi:hypothetical protein P3W85_21175 [Cupriavidus basilensis]|uniref:Uncharacterized protein n=1 Tax=Cupriavidus basilensis TaxID=68895 RepID=A0ABT6AS39_9BURK|nr:hypothetical protein [Cupriavidus basilensis]MDF3835448.1 hypothetical protein [Cupriavidus basilensis]